MRKGKFRQDELQWWPIRVEVEDANCAVGRADQRLPGRVAGGAGIFAVVLFHVRAD
jgi:hypothetical protein